MSDFDTEVDATQDEAESVEALRKKIAALEKDNQKYREERRVAADAAFLDKYGEAIVADVADLPDEHRERMAETLLKLRSASTEKHEPASEAPSQGEQEPSGLAVVATTPSSGAPATEELMTTAEIKKLAKSDPQAAARLVNAGKFVQAEDW